jgi:hypothetical protein
MLTGISIDGQGFLAIVVDIDSGSSDNWDFKPKTEIYKPTLSFQQVILLSNPFTNRYKVSKIETS